MTLDPALALRIAGATAIALSALSLVETFTFTVRFDDAKIVVSRFFQTKSYDRCQVSATVRETKYPLVGRVVEVHLRDANQHSVVRLVGNVSDEGRDFIAAVRS